MKKKPYARFIKGQIALAATEDNLLMIARELVSAKDTKGINLFWDENEELFLRGYLESTEDSAVC